MITQDTLERRARAADELQKCCPHLDAQPIVDSLNVGMDNIRNLLLTRATDDVVRKYGVDTTTAPSAAALERQTRAARTEIEAYSCIVVDDEVGQSGYVDNTAGWFLDWMFRLRLSAEHEHFIESRVDYYRSPTIEERRLKFLSVLQRAIPESAKAPLILFRLFPRSVRIVAAVAFGDSVSARVLRDEQAGFLPAIGYCHDCRGQVLDNDEICNCCGNPIWEYRWLLSD